VSRSRAEAAPSFLLVPGLGQPGDELALEAEERHYVARVCRARAGESLTATDGRGALAQLTLLEVGARVTARIDSIERRERLREATLWCGAPEGTRADWLVEKLAEFGIATLQPLDCARSTWRGGADRLDRWRRLAAAALRQSRQSRLMRIEPPRSLRELEGTIPPGSALWLADPKGARGEVPATRGFSIAAVGPAEGFDFTELELLKNLGFRPISLSEARLRSETAAIAWAAWWANAAP
jgi:16S rRNA (uracil1498-N3)-methyltransferase